MRIDLTQQVGEAEELLAGLRALDSSEVDDEARGRGAREQRADLALRLQKLAHQADVIRVALIGTHLALRDSQGRGDGAAQGAEATR
jgi:hypothetical protein